MKIGDLYHFHITDMSFNQIVDLMKQWEQLTPYKWSIQDFLKIQSLLNRKKIQCFCCYDRDVLASMQIIEIHDQMIFCHAPMWFKTCYQHTRKCMWFNVIRYNHDVLNKQFIDIDWPIVYETESDINYTWKQLVNDIMMKKLTHQEKYKTLYFNRDWIDPPAWVVRVDDKWNRVLLQI